MARFKMRGMLTADRCGKAFMMMEMIRNEIDV